VSGAISVVHNGIIENHDEIRARLHAAGYVFLSDTDTEVIAHLVHEHRKSSATLFKAVQKTLRELVGAYAIAVIDEADPEHIVVARMGAPLLLGLGDGANYAASDASALVQVTPRIVYLEEGDCAELSRERIRIVDAAGNAVIRAEQRSQLTAEAVELGPYRHYMQKEIFEQPMAVANTLEMVTNASAISPQLFGAGADKIFNKINANRYDLAAAYFQLGLTYQKMGEFQNSQINFEQAIILFTEAEVPLQVERVQKAIQKQ